MMLADSLTEGRWAEENTDLRVVKVFPWATHWSTLLVKSPATTLRPAFRTSVAGEPADP